MDWFSDTSANQHVTPDLANPTGCEPYLGNNNLHVNDSNGLSIFNIRHTTLHTTKHIFTLSNVLQVPHIIKPLFFIQKFYLTIMCFLNFICFFYVKDFTTKAMLLSVLSMNGLYVQSQSFTMSIPQVYWSSYVSASTDNYHSQLSHPYSHVFNFLVSNNKMTCNFRRFNFQCQACPLGKSLRLSLGSAGHKTSAPLDLIFNDVWGYTPNFSSDDFFLFCYFYVYSYKMYMILFSYCEMWCLFYFPLSSSLYWVSIFLKN
jgi:hypothetical protein